MKVNFSIEYHSRWGESLTLVLNDKKYPMTWGEGDVWTVTVPNVTAKALEDYSYVLMQDGLITRLEWVNHSFKPKASAKTFDIRDSWIDCPVWGCPFPRKHIAEKFDRPGFRGAGIAVPVFSLRTERDFGIGDFRDLRPLVDFAVSTGQCLIQLLPINDTTRKG
ncbi:MAG: 4-alpha-glucanotransferase, partial [Bacteroidales bacterium]|nr:4-alpha-glucanotransferase [Bacteroidales bacterium]